MCGTRFAEPDTFSVFEGCFGVFGGGTRLLMPKTICAPGTSSLKPGSGATEGVLDQGALGHSDYVTWAGLMGYEDTRQKTPSRVRMGLSFAWMASLVFGYVDSFLCKPTLYNPRPLRCLHKPEGLVRRGNHNHIG